MEEKITAVYLLVWTSELTPEDRGSFERPLERQKQACVRFLESKGIPTDTNVAFYKSRGDLLTDIERDRIARIVVFDTDRLGATKEDVDAFLFEAGARQIEVLPVQTKTS